MTTKAEREMAASQEWREATERHRSLVADACPRCGNCAVELGADGYRCGECGWRPEEAS